MCSKPCDLQNQQTLNLIQHVCWAWLSVCVCVPLGFNAIPWDYLHSFLLHKQVSHRGHRVPHWDVVLVFMDPTESGSCTHWSAWSLVSSVTHLLSALASGQTRAEVDVRQTGVSHRGRSNLSGDTASVWMFMTGQDFTDYTWRQFGLISSAVVVSTDGRYIYLVTVKVF